MTEDELIVDRLHALAREVPAPGNDPGPDVRRGRAALRRRRARRALGGGVAVVAVAAVSAAAFQLPVPDGTHAAVDDAPAAASEPGGTSPASRTPEPVPALTCSDVPQRKGTPAMRKAVLSYQQATAAILDPEGQHVDPVEIRTVTNMQTGTQCDPVTDEFQLQALGAKVGWTSGGRLGLVQVEVASADLGDDLQVVAQRSGWATYAGPLPDGVERAQLTEYAEDGGGHAVVVRRADGLTVAVDAVGVFGNNAAPGAPAAGTLPDVERLLEVAASDRLTLPHR